jgi:hypothetical protein
MESSALHVGLAIESTEQNADYIPVPITEHDLVDYQPFRGETFAFIAWAPPPPEWVTATRNDDGSYGFLAMRSEPGAPSWRADEPPAWDHDHCERCSQRLTNDPAYDDGQPAGWRTGEDWRTFRWFCDRCFNDLREALDFRVAK